MGRGLVGLAGDLDEMGVAMSEPKVVEMMAVGAMVAAAWGSLVGAQWRVLVAWLAVAQVGVFALLWGPWPPAQAVAWLVAGWLTAAMLGLSQRAAPRHPEPFAPGDTLLRLTLGLLAVLVALSLAPKARAWFPGTDLPRSVGGLSMALLGLLQVSLSHHPLRVISGLLIVLGGFSVFYALVEHSLLVTGLLAGFEVVLALGCGYLMLIQATAREEQS